MSDMGFPWRRHDHVWDTIVDARGDEVAVVVGERTDRTERTVGLIADAPAMLKLLEEWMNPIHPSDSYEIDRRLRTARLLDRIAEETP